MNRWLETDTQKTARNIINVLNESAAGMVKKEINKDKPEEAPKNKKVALEKRVTRAAIKGKKPESKNAKMPKKIAKKVVKEELEPEIGNSIEDQIADLQDYLDNTPEVSDEERAEIQAEIDDLISQLGEKEVDNKIMNEEQSNETDIIARLKSGDEVFFRDEDGQALIGRYAKTYEDPEKYDEGYKPENGGSEEALAAAKEAAKDGEVWEFITADDAGQSLGEVYTFCYGEKELADFLTQLREVKKVTRLEESAITEGIEEISRDLCANKDTFKYQMLSRLQNDCDYFLKAGNRSPSVLWAKNVDDHIKLMRDLYNSFAEEDKPEWITLDKIEEYEKEMKDNTLEEDLEAELFEKEKLNEKINHANDDINRAIANPNLGKNRDKIHAAGYEVTDSGLIKNPKTKKWIDPSQYSREEKKKVDFKGKLDSERKNNQGRYYPEDVPKSLKTGEYRGYPQADKDDIEAQNGISQNIKDYKAAVETRDENRKWAERRRKEDIPYYEKKVKDAQKDLEFQKNYTDELEKDADRMENKRKEILDKARATAKKESLEQNEEDGWGEDVLEICEPFFEKVERTMYEVRNARRGSYAHFGDTVSDLAAWMGELSTEAEDVQSELDDMKEQLQESDKNKLKEEYSEKFGGDSKDFIGDLISVKHQLSKLNLDSFGSHLARQMVEDFIETCDRQIEKAKRLASGDEFYTEADDKDESEEGLSLDEKVARLKLMDQAARSCNDEELVDIWLTYGIPDEETEDGFEDDANDYERIEKEFKNIMQQAVKDKLFGCPEEALAIAKEYAPEIENIPDNTTAKSEEANYLSPTRKEEHLDLVAYEPEITSIDEVKDKYVKIKGDFHKVIDVKPEGDKFVISFAAGTGTAVGGEFEPATLDEIKRLQLYTENK